MATVQVGFAVCGPWTNEKRWDHHAGMVWCGSIFFGSSTTLISTNKGGKASSIYFSDSSSDLQPSLFADHLDEKDGRPADRDHEIQREILLNLSSDPLIWALAWHRYNDSTKSQPLPRLLHLQVWAKFDLNGNARMQPWENLSRRRVTPKSDSGVG